MTTRAIGGHHRGYRGATDVWLTPPDLLRRLGPFDLDPCAAEFQAWRPWETAKESWTWGGLERPWHGFAWLNPPYGPDTGEWLAKLADYRDGLALVFARTETDFFHRHVWKRCEGLLFLEGRLHFHYPNGLRAKANSGAPSVLVGYSPEGIKRLAESGLHGELVLMAAAILRTPANKAATWRDVVLEAFDTRGPLSLNRIYRAAEGSAKVREAKEAGHNWRAQLRRTLQRHFETVGPATWAQANA